VTFARQQLSFDGGGEERPNPAEYGRARKEGIVLTGDDQRRRVEPRQLGPLGVSRHASLQLQVPEDRSDGFSPQLGWFLREERPHRAQQPFAARR
jgi:hypothetical protein